MNIAKTQRITRIVRAIIPLCFKTKSLIFISLETKFSEGSDRCLNKVFLRNVRRFSEFVRTRFMAA